MLLKLLKSKIHRAVVTETKLHYTGSIAIDSALMDAAGIVPYESVLVADITNGNRLETYVVPAEAGSGEVSVLGAAAQLVKTGDMVIIISFAWCTPEEAETHKPKVLVIGADNKIDKVL